MMDGQQSLTLHWRSFSRWGGESYTFAFAYKGSKYYVDEYVVSIAPQITEDTWQTFIDALLTPFLKMGQGGYCNRYAWKGGQEFLYDCLQSIGSVTTPDTQSKMVDGLLMFMFKKRSGGCCYNLCQ